MAQHARPKVVHFYDSESHHILCGEADPGAHWTIRSGVSCAECSTLLRDRHRPGASHAAEAATHS